MLFHLGCSVPTLILAEASHHFTGILRKGLLNKKRRGISRSSIVDKKSALFCGGISLQCG